MNRDNKINTKQKNDTKKQYKSALDKHVEAALNKAFGKYPNLYKKVK